MLALLAALAWLPLCSAAATDEGKLAYRVVVEAPPALKPAIERSLGLVRWQAYEEMTAELLDRLVREADDQARNAVATEGFFSARTNITVARPAPGSDDPMTVRVTVDPGPATRVTRVDLRIAGPAADDVPAGTDAVARAQVGWQLPVGEIFRQQDWDAAKRGAVATMTASPYASARLESSEARIDPDAQSAELAVVIASGPRFYFGGLDISGLSRYSPALVRNFSTLAEGEAYSEVRLDQFIRRLNAAGYFASVHASIETDPDQAHHATVRVSVIEAQPRRFEGGLGFSTDTQVRGNFRYSDANVNGKAMQLSIDGRADAKIQELSLRLVRPPNDDGYIDSFETKAERSDIEGLETITASVGLTRRTLEERNHTVYRAFYYEDDQRPEGAPAIRSHALHLEYERTWRNVDHLIAPTRGYVLSGRLGGGPPGVSTRTYGRAILQVAAWQPLGQDSTLDLRAEAGAVAATSRDGIPSALLFRTGGDTTVRGYAFDSLGVKRGAATVGGRYYAIGSIEAIRYFSPLWGIAVFVDAGNAGDDWRSLGPVLGYGAGVRVRSPIGPLRLDVAYGQETRQARLHMSVGLAF